MFGENLKNLRKQKGLSQESIAAQQGVVRQTVSKWEKGLSVPDADMLLRLGEMLEVPVSQLLGSMVEDVEEKDMIGDRLAQIAEQLAAKNRRSRRIWKWIAGILIAILVVSVVLFVLNYAVYSELKFEVNPSVSVIGADDAEVVNTYSGLKTYYELSDGTWLCESYRYKYLLEIEGQIPNSNSDAKTTFLYLSNLEDIPFDRAWKAAGLSSSMSDYFSLEDAVLIGWDSSPWREQDEN